MFAPEVSKLLQLSQRIRELGANKEFFINNVESRNQWSPGVMSFQWERGGDGGRRNSNNTRTCRQAAKLRHTSSSPARFSSQMTCRVIVPHKLATCIWNLTTAVCVCAAVRTHTLLRGC